jgi:uncharacterized membrane protein YfcA
MRPWDLLLIPAGFAGGLLNSAADGGSLITFIVLGILTGTPLAANATNLMAVPFSYARALLRYQASREHAWLLLSAACGCATGVLLLAYAGNAAFATAAPWLVLGAALMLLGEPLVRRLRRSNDDTVTVGSSVHAPTCVGLFCVSIYAGVFGASFGTLVLAVFVLIAALPLDDATARLKNTVCLTTSVVGLVAIPLLRLPVNWPLFALLIVPMFTGGWLGERLLTRWPRQRIRAVAIVVSLAGAARLFIT